MANLRGLFYPNNIYGKFNFFIKNNKFTENEKKRIKHWKWEMYKY